MIDSILKHGLNFQIDIERDADTREPWKEHDGHGVVIEYRNGYGDYDETKFWPLGSSWLYDVEASAKRAEEENWGSGKTHYSDMVEQDYEHLRAWCNDEWYWCGVVVTLLDVNGDRLPILESLWGIESDSDEYLEQVANELASQIINAYKIAPTATRLDVRDTTYTIRG